MISVKDTPAVAWKTRVYLDEAELKNCCIGADPIEGWADVYVPLYEGWPWTQEDLIVRRLYGSVRLEAIE
jgi:hypothetical protein